MWFFGINQVKLKAATFAVNEPDFASLALPQNQDSLDSILPTMLDVPDDEFYDLVQRRRTWWDSARLKAWMSGKGYTLYQRVYRSSGDSLDLVRLHDARRQDTSFPYAHHGGPTEDVRFDAKTGPRVRLVIFFMLCDTCNLVQEIVGYALDSQGRHVAIKAVLSGSEEYCILKYLQNEGVPKSIDNFRNVIPILDIIACEGHWLAVMPRSVPFFAL